MAFDFKQLKAKKKPIFHKDFEKYYPVTSLREMGFSRKVCSKCGKGFWSTAERSVCGEPECEGGYSFIGQKLTKKEFTYKGAWDEYVKTFEKWGYIPLKRYPVVCRWYDQLYFVNAGVNDFQPYVIAGVVEPPADAVLEPQFCLRFPDIDSVGVTGRHYTGFIMVGQHTFRTPQKPNVYFKEEGIKQMNEFLTKGLGIAEDELVYHEDVWAGGGNFGPSMEFFARGLELGNQVYMQYEVLPDGSDRELKTQVIDMGAGLERWSWFSQGTPMSYDTVFPKVMDYLYKQSGFKPGSDFMAKYGKYAGLLNFDEIDDAGSVWGKVATETGIELNELQKQVYQLRSLYAIADHTRTLVVAIHDGALPSNVGGGYNLRFILRRCWNLMAEYGYELDLPKVFDLHIEEFGQWYTELKDKGMLHDIIEIEEKRHKETLKKGRALVERMVSSDEKITTEKLIGLYDSQGIPPSIIKDIKPDLVVPDDFLAQVQARHEEVEKELVKGEELPNDLPETEQSYYQYENDLEFEAKVSAKHKDYLVLDKTYFYPEGGGQETDLGTINGLEVEMVEKANKAIAHKVKGGENVLKNIKVGDIVKGKVLRERRKQLTIHHTATHVINAAAGRVLGPHIWQAGAHKSMDGARLDVTHYKAVTEAELKKIEEEANKIITNKIPVIKSIMKRNEAEGKHGFRLYQGGAVPGKELRIVEIKGVDAEACGGTHLDNTSEIGLIRLVRATRIQDGIVRLEFKAGPAAEKEESSEEKIHQECVTLLGQFKPIIRETINRFPKERISVSEELEMASAILRVQKTQLPNTIKRFISESQSIEAKLGRESFYPTLIEPVVKLLPHLVEDLFHYWKALHEDFEKQQAQVGSSLKEEILSSLDSSNQTKKLTEGLNVKDISEVAKEVVEGKKGSVVVILNIVGEKANVVIASSDPKVDAGELTSKISAQLGGGGRGTKELGIGGGKAEKAQEVLDSFPL
ncbi:MAG: alanine--tRNA ligase [Candidatus Altiarchaeota archaeon]